MTDRQRGFTLIEVLVSITLVAAISTGLLIAMRSGLLTLEKTRTRFDEDRRALGIQQILVHQLSGVMPVRGNCSAGGTGSLAPVFGGNSSMLRLASNYSMTDGSRGSARILQYQVAQDTGATFKLIMIEQPYGSSFGACGPPEALAQTQAVEIASGLAYCRFSYEDVLFETFIGNSKWLDEWIKPDLPAAVRIDMALAVPDASRLPVLSVTVPIHVTRQSARNPYVDLE